MVAETIRLPNVRKMFVPDPGYVIIDADLERADAQVVAWDSGDEVLKQIFREGLDIHTENAAMLFNVPASKVSYEQRQKAKTGCHAVNYVCSERTLAAHLKITVHEASEFKRRWFEIHPPILKWHQRVEQELKLTRVIRNAFGYRYFYVDRLEDCVSTGVGWIGQSTTSISIHKGLLNIFKNLPQVELLLQVHDSLVMQVPEDLFPNICLDIHKNMLITVPYPDPLIIPVSMQASPLSWGDVEKVDLRALYDAAA